MEIEERWKIRLSDSNKLSVIPFDNGLPDSAKIKKLSSWIKKNKDIYLQTYVPMYHGTGRNIPVLEQGLLPTSTKRRRSFQSESGYVYLANTPEKAKIFGDLGNMSNTVVYEVLVPVIKLLPDKDQLNNLRAVGANVGNSLAESLVYGGGARIKGSIAPWQIQEFNAEKQRNTVMEEKPMGNATNLDNQELSTRNFTTPEQVIDRVKEILDAEHYLKKTGENSYEGEIYTDYRDELGKENIAKILESKNPRETFYEIIDEANLDSEFYAKSDVVDKIKENFDDEELGFIYTDHSDTIEDWVYGNVSFGIDYDQFLSEKVYIDIIVDTGDGNTDFSLNNPFPNWYGEYGKELSDESSILWLAKQQGCSEKVLNKALTDGKFGGSKFLESLREEVKNCTTSMNALTFFTDMTLKEAIDLNEKLSKGLVKSLTISKDATCGLYDPWNGAGGLLNITLDKDVKLPAEFIDSARIDGSRGYSAESIWGIIPDNVWTGSVKIEEKPKSLMKRLEKSTAKAAELNTNREKQDKSAKSKSAELE